MENEPQREGRRVYASPATVDTAAAGSGAFHPSTGDFWLGRRVYSSSSESQLSVPPRALEFPIVSFRSRNILPDLSLADLSSKLTPSETTIAAYGKGPLIRMSFAACGTIL